MINEINIKNIITGASIDFMSDKAPFVIDEIDWDSPTVSMESYRVPYQVGTTLSGVTVGTRKPSITGYVIADMSNENTLGMTWKEYFDIQKKQVEENKLKLDKLISVYQDVIIQVGEYYLLARPTQPPKYSNTEKQNNEVLCYFTIEFECYNPLFYKQSKLVNLAMTVDLFHFPLIIPKTDKVVFGEVLRRQSISVENGGDADVGCVIKIYASGGSVKNPKVYNVNTEEFIEFEDVTLNNGDYITITTDIGEENAIKHIASTTENVSVIGNIKAKSKFFQIKQGSNYYAYSVEEEYINNVEVSIEYTERYFNVRGM